MPVTENGAMPEINFEKYVLPNGLQVILHIDRKLPVVHVNQWFHVGSKNERPGRTGFAHLFEHIMFQGSLNASGDYFSWVEKAGANLREGGVNGTTSFDRTNYFATVPSGNLEYLLWLESDRLATLTDALTQAKLDNQREVVRNERRQTYENVPYGRWINLLFENIHPKEHPYSWMVIGSHEDLTAASLDDVKEFFRTYYTPNNLTVVIAGDFDPDEAKRLLEKYYGQIPPGPALERPRRFIPRLHGERIVEVADRVPQERIYLSWPAPEYFGQGEAELEIAAMVLSDGLSSRLNRTLVYDRQLATSVSAFDWGSEISGVFVIVADVRPGASADEVLTIITGEIERLAREGPSPEELQRAKNKWEYEYVSGLERIGGFGGKADRLAQYNVFLGDPGRFDADVERFRAVTAESVRASVDRWLNHSNRLLLRFHPEPSSRGEGQQEIDRSTAPPLSEDLHFQSPSVQQTTLQNGIELFVVTRTDLPKVAVALATRAGTIDDPVGQEGLAHFTASTIDLGTTGRSALEIEDAMGDLGSSLSGFATRRFSILGFATLKRNLSTAMPIFADVITDPIYPDAELAREKERLLDALAQQANDPNSLAARIRPMLIFGYDHPYGRPAQGIPSTVRTINRDDVLQFHRSRWKPGGSALIFAGDVTMEEAKELATSALGSWHGKPFAGTDVPSPVADRSASVFIVDRPDAAQTVVSILMPGPNRLAEDYYAFRLLDAVWGSGGFGTRLNLNIREDKGYSYGVFSGTALYPECGAWWASGSIQTDKTAPAVAEFIRELEDLEGRRPVSDDEVNYAREVRVRGYAQQFESLQRIAGQIAELWALGLPMTEMQREVEETARATMDEIRAATERYVHPEAAVILLVGDLARIGPELRALNLSPVAVIDAEGQRLRTLD